MRRAAAGAAVPSGLRRLFRSRWPGTGSAKRLVSNAEGLGYWVAVAPLAARLPASLAYRIACWRGDWISRFWAEKGAEITHNLRQVLGDELDGPQAERATRDFFRFLSCEVVDVMRLRGRARPLEKLVEIRGRENLDAALAAGKGVILCSAHFGSHISASSLLHANGYPLTTVGRWYWKYEPGMTSPERRFWDLVYARRVLRHRQRPNIEPWPGRLQVAAQVAAALRGNEVVMICSDAEPLEADRPRAVEVPFLGRPATLMPGVVNLAKLTGAPVLMAFVHRKADYRHQVLEISPPVPMQGDTATAFGRCVAAMDAEIRARPANWFYWSNTEALATIGLLPPLPPAEAQAISPEPRVGVPVALLADGGVGHGSPGPPGSVTELPGGRDRGGSSSNQCGPGAHRD